MVFQGIDAATVRKAYYYRHPVASAGTVMIACYVRDNLVEGGVDETAELHLDNRAQACNGHPDSSAGDA
jgi:hypothetical protein